MTQYLRIDSSPRSSKASVSRQLADIYFKDIAAQNVTIRNASRSFPNVDTDWIGANFTPANDRSTAQKEALALSDKLVDELQVADVIVISTPIYNFGVPAPLKSWIDLICRAGVTFQYTPQGPVGLMKGKRAVILTASGGTKAGSDIDFATPYLRQVMNFIGISDVEIIAADGHMGDETSIGRAKDAAQTLAAAE